LATQIENVIKELGYHLGIVVTSCVGGTDRRRDVEILEKGAHVVVGTPGRVFDMMRSDILDGKK